MYNYGDREINYQRRFPPWDGFCTGTVQILCITTQGGNSLTFMTGVIMSGHFLRPPNMLTKFFKDPKYVD